MVLEGQPHEAGAVHQGHQDHPQVRAGIRAAIKLNINNARAEGLNNHVRLNIRRAYGFHSPEAALALVMLTCGPIQLRLPHESAVR